MNNPKPKGEGWVKTPSVTTGGKRYFWFRRNPKTDKREWFIWNRIYAQWVYQNEDGNIMAEPE